MSQPVGSKHIIKISGLGQIHFVPSKKHPACSRHSWFGLVAAIGIPTVTDEANNAAKINVLNMLCSKVTKRHGEMQSEMVYCHQLEVILVLACCRSIWDVATMKTLSVALCAFALSITTAGPASAQSSTPDAVPQEPDISELDDVNVVATPLGRSARAFVSSVAAPVQGRKPAAWRERICVGVGGMRPEPAQALADRVSQWGERLGLSSGAPGCTPNIFIVATNDGDATARELVISRPRQFHTGADGTDQGRSALGRFQTSGRLVRWWHVSLPVNESTGAAAGRLPGDPPYTAPSVIRGPADLGTFGNSVSASLVNDGTRDDLMQVIIVLEDAALDQASFTQVADYVAMVALAQIDPDASPASPSILTLFDTSKAQESGLTRWDLAYLQALYGTAAGSRSPASSLSGISAGMTRELRQEEPAPPTPSPR